MVVERPLVCVANTCKDRPLPGTNFCGKHQSLA
jgi:hypothetical protein